MIKLKKHGHGGVIFKNDGNPIIELGGGKIKTTNLLLKEFNADYLVLKNAADSAYKGLVCGILALQGNTLFGVDGLSINAPDVDDNFILLRARDNGVGLIEIARLAGGATPYFEIKAGKLTGTLECNSQVLKDLKNSAASALSGTQKDIEIDIGGTPYYFTVYPTKA